MMRVSRYVGVIAVCVVAAGCGKKQAPAQPVPDTGAQPGPSMPPARDDDAEARARAEAEARAREVARKRAVLEEKVFFGYDRSDLEAAQVETLRRKVELLRDDTTIMIRIEGHADERGSLEYNLALGMRRAQAVKDYLVGFGLEGMRFAVETLGEDRPAATGSGEAAWSQNRRAEFVVTAGLSNVR